MIYTILRVAWWAVCLGIGLLIGIFEWNDPTEKQPLKIFAFIIIVSMSILIAAAVQVIFTWIGSLFLR